MPGKCFMLKAGAECLLPSVFRLLLLSIYNSIPIFLIKIEAFKLLQTPGFSM